MRQTFFFFFFSLFAWNSLILWWKRVHALSVLFSTFFRVEESSFVQFPGGVCTSLHLMPRFFFIPTVNLPTPFLLFPHFMTCSLSLCPRSASLLPSALNAKPQLSETPKLFWESKCHFTHITSSLFCHGDAVWDNSDLVPLAHTSARTNTYTRVVFFLFFLTSSDLASRMPRCLSSGPELGP